MDKKIQQSILILGVLFVLVTAFAIVFYLQKQAAENRAALLSNQVTEFETKDRETQKKMKSLQEESSKLRQDLDQRNTEREALLKKSEQAKQDIDKLNEDLKSVQKERSEWDSKLSGLRRERDDLIKQVTDLKSRPAPEKIVEKIVYRDRVDGTQGMSDMSAGVAPAQAMNEVFAAAINSSMPTGVNRENENYWAGVIKQKASLEIELQKLKKICVPRISRSPNSRRTIPTSKWNWAASRTRKRLSSARSNMARTWRIIFLLNWPGRVMNRNFRKTVRTSFWPRISGCVWISSS